MILDAHLRSSATTECRIIVTQPRRIAAISLATRIAKERGEQVGETVGYQVTTVSNRCAFARVIILADACMPVSCPLTSFLI